MRLRLAVYAVVAVCGCLPLAADDPPPEVTVETAGGQTFTGTLLTSTIRLKTEFGTQDIESRFVQRLTFSPPDASGGHDVLELKDHTHVLGQVISDAIRVQTADGDRTFLPDD